MYEGGDGAGWNEAVRVLHIKLQYSLLVYGNSE